MDHIATLRSIVKESVDCQFSLYTIFFVDFEKAFLQCMAKSCWSCAGAALWNTCQDSQHHWTSV